MSHNIILKEKTKFPTILKKRINFKKTNKIVISKAYLPEDSSFDEKIAWICASTGFFENIDKNKNATKIFQEIFLAGTQNQILTSTTISEKINMSRGSTINHLNKLVNAGLIEKNGKYYFSRQKTMHGIITEIEDDLTHIFSRMKKVAKEIDSQTNSIITMK